jgi:RNA polymerase sigma-70 factor (ECF subfamily)
MTKAEFEHIYDAHHRGVFATALRIVRDEARAEDVVQDVFLKLWRKPDRFDPSRGDLGAYLRLMGRSRALDLYRESQAAGRASDRLKLAVAREEPRVEEQPVEAVTRAEEGGAVRAALHTLPAAQSEALVLAYWGGLTSEQIADHVGIPLGTAKSRLRLALRKMRCECDGRHSYSTATS